MFQRRARGLRISQTQLRLAETQLSVCFEVLIELAHRGAAELLERSARFLESELIVATLQMRRCEPLPRAHAIDEELHTGRCREADDGLQLIERLRHAVRRDE